MTLVEYGDFECPDCGRAHGIVHEVLERMGDRMRFIFRPFPLAKSHPHAQHAAEAAEAAAAQGQFWAMHDMLFTHQKALTDADLTRYAEEIGLDLARFTADLDSHTYATKVRASFMGGLRSGVNGTPTFFTNGIRHDGDWDSDSLVAALEQGT